MKAIIFNDAPGDHPVHELMFASEREPGKEQCSYSALREHFYCNLDRIGIPVHRKSFVLEAVQYPGTSNVSRLGSETAIEIKHAIDQGDITRKNGTSNARQVSQFSGRKQTSLFLSQ